MLDGFGDTLGIVGQNLVKLDLHHVDNIDLNAVVILSVSCQRLQYLGLSGCIFNHPDREPVENSQENYHQKQ